MTDCVHLFVQFLPGLPLRRCTFFPSFMFQGPTGVQKPFLKIEDSESGDFAEAIRKFVIYFKLIFCLHIFNLMGLFMFIFMYDAIVYNYVLMNVPGELGRNA